MRPYQPALPAACSNRLPAVMTPEPPLPASVTDTEFVDMDCVPSVYQAAGPASAAASRTLASMPADHKTVSFRKRASAGQAGLANDFTFTLTLTEIDVNVNVN